LKITHEKAPVKRQSFPLHHFSYPSPTPTDAQNERQEPIAPWEATIRPLRQAPLRIRITGEGANGAAALQVRGRTV